MGHRPAITVVGVGPDLRRDEQAFASLAQWAAKGAHLLEVDLGLGPEDRLHVDAPAGWLPAAVCLAAWWVGAAVTDDATGARASVVHEDRPAHGHLEVFRIGDAVDGRPLAQTDDLSWAVEVQAFPDQPPMPRGAPDLVAVSTAAGSFTQAELLDRARAGPRGRLGIAGDLDVDGIATWLAARPVATADSSVLVPSGAIAAAKGEGVAHWLGN